MRSTWLVLLVVFVVVSAFGRASSQVCGVDKLGPSMDCVGALDLNVFIESITEPNLSKEIAKYLDSGAVCKFLGVALHSKEPNRDRLYRGCAAFQRGSDWDAILWDYEYDDSSSSGRPSIPYDGLTYRMVLNPEGAGGLDTILADRVSWDFLVYVCRNCPKELRDELGGKTLKRVWVERVAGRKERVLSYWRYEGGGRSRTWRVWATLRDGEFGPLNVD